jgi:hypothetical protein
VAGKCQCRNGAGTEKGCGMEKLTFKGGNLRPLRHRCDDDECHANRKTGGLLIAAADLAGYAIAASSKEFLKEMGWTILLWLGITLS